MKYSLLVVAIVAIIPHFVFAAQEFGDRLDDFGVGIIGFINNILFPLALAIAFIFLVWGIVKYFVIGGDSDDSQKSGKQMIIYSIAGFVIILSLYGLVNILTSAIGLGETKVRDLPLPEVPTRPVGV